MNVSALDTTSHRAIAPADITGLVLAGGRGTRMGGVDKGLQTFLGQDLVGHAIARLAPQVGTLLVNANRHLDTYRRHGWPVIADPDDSRAGPLAGIECGLRAARTPWLVSVPCDAPLLPFDLVERLARAVVHRNARIAVARTVAGRHPVVAMISTDSAPHLATFLASGGRRVREWQDLVGAVEVEFDGAGHTFDNINTIEALQTLERDLCPRSPLS